MLVVVVIFTQKDKISFVLWRKYFVVLNKRRDSHIYSTLFALQFLGLFDLCKYKFIQIILRLSISQSSSYNVIYTKFTLKFCFFTKRMVFRQLFCRIIIKNLALYWIIWGLIGLFSWIIVPILLSMLHDSSFVVKNQFNC